MAKLTEKQQRFIDEYCVDLNATQAAIKAGYSPKTSYSIGQENLKKPEISEQIERRKQEMVKNLRERFAFDAVKAREVMYEILTDEESADKDKITVARDFLDRAGFKPADKVKLESAAKVVIVDDIDE